MEENISSCCCLGVGDLLRLSSSLSATEDTNNFMTLGYAVLGLLGLIGATSLLAAMLVWEGDGWVLEQTTGRVVGLVVVLGFLGLIAATSLLAAMLVWEGDGWVLEQTTGRVVGLVVVLGLLGLIAATSLLAAMLVWESQLLN